MIEERIPHRLVEGRHERLAQGGRRHWADLSSLRGGRDLYASLPVEGPFFARVRRAARPAADTAERLDDEVVSGADRALLWANLSENARNSGCSEERSIFFEVEGGIASLRSLEVGAGIVLRIHDEARNSRFVP